MSMWLAAQAWNCKLDKTRLVILMALCDSAEDDGTNCYPSSRYIAWKTGSSLATVYRVLAEFEANKYLEAVGTKGSTVEYVIHIENVPLKPAYQRLKQGRPHSKKSSHSEKSFSSGEKKRTVRKSSSPREDFSHHENGDSHHEKKEHRLGRSSAPNNSRVASKRDDADPILSIQAYDPVLENSGAPAPAKIERADPEPEPETPPVAGRPPYDDRAFRRWALSQIGGWTNLSPKRLDMMMDRYCREKGILV